jgi:hypothetical protein
MPYALCAVLGRRDIGRFRRNKIGVLTDDNEPWEWYTAIGFGNDTRLILTTEGEIMENLQVTVALVLSVGVMFLAPALVWALAIGGLVRIVRKKVQESQVAQTGLAQEAQQTISSN